jgi:glycosyltransferase involved in cell wall biosynthesis/SAM-dependent methyltransferase
LGDFPWTYDQLQRYSALREFLSVFHPGGTVRILDVGGLSPDRIGTGHWLPVRAVSAGESVVVDLPDIDLPGYVRGDGTGLPFEDGSFDVVAALDVLEHVPEDARPKFLAEMARVARESVFLCAPFRGPENDASDKLLSEQVRRVYGVVQEQLREHRLYGLPDGEAIDRQLAGLIPAGGTFSYGSLLTWLPYQSIKNAFMMRLNSGTIHALLDRWMASLGGRLDHEPPFARRFWVRSRTRTQAEFDVRFAEVQDRLRRLAPEPPSFDDLARLNREIVAYATAPAVSGIVVALGNNDRLTGSLDRLLTQDVDFELEVAVWDLSPGGAAAAFVAERYPQVKYFPAPPSGRPVLSALGALLGGLRGDLFLLMTEDILLTPGIIRALAAEMREGQEGAAAVLAPIITDEKNARWIESGGGGDWVRGDCLFFDRAALFDRRCADQPLDRDSLFRWERVPKTRPARIAGGVTAPILTPRGGEKPVPPLKVVHCLHQYHPARGGAEWLMQNVSERLVARGVEVSVIATTARSTEDYFLPGRGKDLLPAGSEKIGGVVVERVPFTRFGAGVLNAARALAVRAPFLPGGDRLRMKSWGPRSPAYKRALAAHAGADIFAAAPLPTLNVWYAWQAARKSGRPFVVVPCFHTEDAWTFHNPLHYRMMRDADAVIALSASEKEFLCREAGLARERVHVLGAGIDLDDAEPAVDIRSKYGITQERIVLFLGQHGAHKGILDLLYAMRLVGKERADTALVIAGNPTAHTAEIERAIAQLADEDRGRVYLVKGVPEAEKRAFYRAADVFVSVSPFESFGIVYLEAWREKLPVIGCRRGAAAGLIEEFRDGLLVHDGNPVELAGAIAELLDDDETRRRMGEAGRRKVAEKYLWEEIIDRWEGIYREIREKRRTA